MAEPAHKSLAEALLAFQAEAPKLPKDGRNPHFKSKFTKLDTIREKVGPLLAKHGLVWQTFPCFGPNGEPALRYVLTHGSESQSDVMPLMLSKANAQELGSAITYGRRYSVTAVLDLVADDDDDGNSASERTRQQQNGRAEQPSAAPAQATERPASAKQRGLLNVRASEAELSPGDFANIILTASGQELREFDSEDAAEQWLKRALDRLPAKLVDPVLNQIERVKDGAAT